MKSTYPGRVSRKRWQAALENYAEADWFFRRHMRRRKRAKQLVLDDEGIELLRTRVDAMHELMAVPSPDLCALMTKFEASYTDHFLDDPRGRPLFAALLADARRLIHA